jgi:hypothetical protein
VTQPPMPIGVDNNEKGGKRIECNSILLVPAAWIEQRRILHDAPVHLVYVFSFSSRDKIIDHGWYKSLASQYVLPRA